MAKKHILGQFHILFPNLDEIYSLMVQAATVLYLVAKNTGAVHLSFYVCLEGHLCCKNMWPHEHGWKQLTRSISEF